jgi:hypothetical protein
LGRALERSGLRVRRTKNYERATAAFRAGFIDVVVADWDLAANPNKKGDALFAELRKRDWEVPLVLVSGKLHEANQRAKTLQRIIEFGPVRFVERGQGMGYKPVLHAIRELLSQRDVLVTQLIAKLREADAHGASIETSGGRLTAGQLLSKLLSDSTWKQTTLLRLAEDFAEWGKPKLTKQPSS